MRHIEYGSNLDSFSELLDLPNCNHLNQGRKLLDQIERRTSTESRLQLTQLLNRLSLPVGGSVLEIGPGCCNYAIEFCQREYKYTGYDMVDENIDVWNVLKTQYNLKAEVLVQDICTVDTSTHESCFDGIFSISTFEHIHDQLQALDNCHRMLKPGGRLVIIDGNILDPRLIFRMLFKRRDGGLLWFIKKHRVNENYGTGWKGKCEDVKSLNWWKKQLINHGFSIVSLTTTSTSRKWIRRLGLWPLFGCIIAVGRKE